ncbi:MAG TPA: hypothetical protein VII57_10035 [Dehalococcoidia bacterium]
MGGPFFLARLGAFTISLLLLSESVEPGWGVAPGWGWYLAICLLTLMTLWDMLSLVAFAIAGLLLVGVIDEGRAAFIALTIFAGVGLVRHLLRGTPWPPRPAQWWGRRAADF